MVDALSAGGDAAAASTGSPSTITSFWVLCVEFLIGPVSSLYPSRSERDPARELGRGQKMGFEMGGQTGEAPFPLRMHMCLL